MKREALYSLDETLRVGLRAVFERGEAAALTVSDTKLKALEARGYLSRITDRLGKNARFPYVTIRGQVYLAAFNDAQERTG